MCGPLTYRGPSPQNSAANPKESFESVLTADAEVLFSIRARRHREEFGDCWLSVCLSPKCDVRVGVRQWAYGRWNFTINILSEIRCWSSSSIFRARRRHRQQSGQSVGGAMSTVALYLVAGALQLLLGLLSSSSCALRPLTSSGGLQGNTLRGQYSCCLQVLVGVTKLPHKIVITISRTPRRCNPYCAND